MAIVLSAEGIIKVCEGLALYKSLKSMLEKDGREVILTEPFQKTYDRFYQIRRNAEWRRQYFKWMYEHYKPQPCPSFEETLKVLKRFDKNKSRVEASFASKLLHTLDDNQPIWDRIVTTRLMQMKEIDKLPPRSSSDYQYCCVKRYETMKQWFASEKAKEYVDCFNSVFPNEPISDIKKVDFVLWGLGTSAE